MTRPFRKPSHCVNPYLRAERLAYRAFLMGNDEDLTRYALACSILYSRFKKGKQE